MPLIPTRAAAFGLLTLSLTMPTAALAQSRLGLATVFVEAAPIMKLLMLIMSVAAVAAIVVTIMKLSSGPRLAGGSSFVSAIRLGGPLLGLAGAIFNLLMMFMGIANAGEPVPFEVLAPGFAEASMLFLIGLFVGVVAVTCHWVIEARIDRTVLSS